jgi:hypothetical protein
MQQSAMKKTSMPFVWIVESRALAHLQTKLLSIDKSLHFPVSNTTNRQKNNDKKTEIWSVKRSISADLPLITITITYNFLFSTMLQRNNSAANKPSKSRCNHHCSVIQRFLLKHSLLKNLTGKPFSKDTAPYKDCLQLLKKCNFGSASQLFNECRHRHRSIAIVCSKSQPSTNIEYLVEHKTIQSKSKTGSHELTSQLCYTNPFLY